MNTEREPLTPEQVLSSLKDHNPLVLNGLREKHSEWIPKLPPSDTFDLRRRNLSKLDLRGIDFSGVDLAGADLRGSRLDGADFSHADLTGADLQETTLWETNFFFAKGLFGLNRARFTPYQASIGSGSERAMFRKPGDYVPWSILRSIGTLRVFGASYITIVILVAYAGWVEWINTTAFRWASMLPAEGPVHHVRQMLLSRVPLIEVAPHFGIQLLMVLCLAVGATLYQLYCPDVVKENSESRWTRELDHSLVEYRAADASFPLARTAALFFYGIGGLYTFAFVLVKIVRATIYFLSG